MAICRSLRAIYHIFGLFVNKGSFINFPDYGNKGFFRVACTKFSRFVESIFEILFFSANPTGHIVSSLKQVLFWLRDRDFEKVEFFDTIWKNHYCGSVLYKYW